MKCPNCGKEIADDSVFCEFCGTKLSTSENPKRKKVKWLPFFMGGLCVIVGIVIVAIISSDAGKVSYDSYSDEESTYGQFEEEPQAETGASMQTSEYVDLGLPSGILWKTQNEGAYYPYFEAKQEFGTQLPSINQWKELQEYCSKSWIGNGWQFYGPNGSSLFLPAEGYLSNGENYITQNEVAGFYWAYNGGYLYFDNTRINVYNYQVNDYHSVRLVKSN